MSSFKERKQKRKDHYYLSVKGKKLINCFACNGSGKYDHDGSPDCGACDGLGKVRES